MSDFLVTPVARAAMELMGEMTCDPFHEFEVDVSALLRAIEREQRKVFNEAYYEAMGTLGLRVSRYCLSYDSGYAGAYAN